MTLAAAPTTTIWTGVKTVGVTGSRHRHKPNPISHGFDPPELCSTISFGPAALAASIARTATLAHATPELVAVIRDSILGRIRHIVAEGPGFSLTSDYGALADTAQVLFAAEVGAGITDLVMNSLGYVWRDNAVSLSSKLKPHADFIYAGGLAAGHGVVLAEARGSFAPNSNEAKTKRQAKEKYLRQVKPNLAKLSAHGKTIHGYSIMFASPFSGSDTYLHAAETLVKRRPASPPGSTTSRAPAPLVQSVPTSLALSSHRSNFALLNAPRVSRWIDWIRFGGNVPDDGEPLRFVQFNYDGRRFLASSSWHWFPHAPAPWIVPVWEDEYWFWRRIRSLRDPYVDGYADMFVIEANAAETFLSLLSSMIRNAEERPSSIEMPSTQPVGFTQDSAERAGVTGEEYVYAMFRDGLAFLRTPPRPRTVELRMWSPRDGMMTLHPTRE